MPLTVKQIIERAHRLATITAGGEQLDAQEVTDGLEALRGVIDRLSLEGLMVAVRSLQTFALTNTQRTYTWLSGGDFNGAPPLDIEAAWFNDGGSVDAAITILKSGDLWARQRVKDYQSRPTHLWADEGHDRWTIYFDALPFDPSVTFVTTTALDTTQALTEGSGFGLGYDVFLAHELAIELCPEYGKEPSQSLMLNHRKHRQAIEKKRLRVPVMRPDPAVRSTGTRYSVEGGPG